MLYTKCLVDSSWLCEVKAKKAKALEPLELVAACQTWLDAQVEEPSSARPNKKRKRDEAEVAEATEAGGEGHSA